VDRKGFIQKTCLAGVCGCGFGALALNAGTVAGAEQECLHPVTKPAQPPETTKQYQL